MHEWLLAGGTVIDGTGSPGFRTDVGLEGDRIAAVGSLEQLRSAPGGGRERTRRQPGIHRRPLPLRVLPAERGRRGRPPPAGDHHRPAVAGRLRVRAPVSGSAPRDGGLPGGVQRVARGRLGMVGQRGVPGDVRRPGRHQRGAPGGFQRGAGRGGRLGPPPRRTGRDRPYTGTHPPGLGAVALQASRWGSTTSPPGMPPPRS